MRPYLVRRLMLAIPTVIGVTIMIFLAMRVIPGDPLRSIIGEGQIYVLSDEELAAVKASLGYDKPLIIQYLVWMRDVAKGDLGYSFWQKDKSIADMVIRRGPITLQISLMALLIAWVIGLPTGIVTALWRNSALDYGIRGVVTLFMAIPNFWLGLAMILATILIWNWRPPVELVSLWESPWTNLQMTIGPAIAMGIGFGAIIARMVRSGMLEVLTEDYVRTALAKGLASRTVVVRHALQKRAASHHHAFQPVPGRDPGRGGCGGARFLGARTRVQPDLRGAGARLDRHPESCAAVRGRICGH